MIAKDLFTDNLDPATRSSISIIRTYLPGSSELASSIMASEVERASILCSIELDM